MKNTKRIFQNCERRTGSYDLRTITVTAIWDPTIMVYGSLDSGTSKCQVDDGDPVALNQSFQLIPAAVDSTVTVTMTPDESNGYIPCKPNVLMRTPDEEIFLTVTRAGVVNNVYTFTFTMPDSPIEMNLSYGEPETVTFDSDGGSVVPAQTVPWSELADRPDDPTKEGFRFLGWFAPGAEEAFNFENTGITEDITLTAHWAQIYTVTTAAPEHGTLGADVAQAIQGETVTLTVEPAEGYAIGSVSYTVASGAPQTITADENGVYSFAMPEGDVTVTAAFITEWAHLDTLLNAGGTVTLDRDYTAAAEDTGGMFFAHHTEALENTKKATDSRWFAIPKVHNTWYIGCCHVFQVLSRHFQALYIRNTAW